MEGFLGLSDHFFVFYYYVFNFNTSPGHETLKYKHKRLWSKRLSNVEDKTYTLKSN